MSSSSSPVGLHQLQQYENLWPSSPSNAGLNPNVTNAADYGDPWAEVKAYGRMVDAAVLSGNSCIYGGHTTRQANCRDCSIVDFSRILKGRKGTLKKESGQSTAHKADTPCLDLYLEYTAMKRAENAGKSSCKEFDQFVNNELKGQVRMCANASAKHWVKMNFWLSEHGALYWGKGDGNQRQIKLQDGSKTQGRIMRDYEAAEMVHKIHQDGHCGRDALIARIQQEGCKPPVKEVVTAWLNGCTGCDRTTKKRSRDDSTPTAVSGPPSKRQKADPRAPKRKARKDSAKLTPEVVLAEAALLPTANAPADHATTAELPHEAFQKLDESGIAPLEFLLEDLFDEAELNATVDNVEIAAREWGIPLNTESPPAELDISWFEV